MRPSRNARSRVTVVAALLTGAGLISSAMAPQASASASPDPATAAPADALADVTAGPVRLLGDAGPTTPEPAAEPATAPTADAAVRPAAAPAVVLPVAGHRLSARFGAGGSRWSSGRHTGLDFTAPSGTLVRAVSAGTVVSAGWDGPYGRAVVLAHTDGTRTRYAHLSADTVSPGERVAAGQRIGRVGSSGNASGAHLHLEVLRGSQFTDPARWLRAHDVSV